MSAHRSIAPADVLDTIRRRMLVDGFDIVLDLDRSEGCRMVDARDGRRYLDFFSFFASSPLGMNHPAMMDQAWRERLSRVAVNKVANSDIYTDVYAEFVDTLDRVARPDYMKYFFFVDGGGLAVENALKVSFDWKVRRNFRKGLKEEKGSQIMHFRRAFHGRTGYTMSLTNTDPRKTMYFPKFDWPRLDAPAVQFPLDAAENERLDALEAKILADARAAFAERADEIAAIIIEPVQCEGGDRHFRASFLKGLRQLADENEALLIFDEVQTGVGMTGKMWCHQNFGVEPDIFSFAKKMQVGGIMVGPRVDLEPDNCFHVSSRINSTWGAHLVDMFRATRILEVIESEKLVDNAAKMGERFVGGLKDLSRRHPVINNVRGLGLLSAVSCPDGETRDAIISACHAEGFLALSCGVDSIRFRPPLTISAGEVDEALAIFDQVLAKFPAPVAR